MSPRNPSPSAGQGQPGLRKGLCHRPACRQGLPADSGLGLGLGLVTLCVLHSSGYPTPTRDGLSATTCIPFTSAEFNESVLARGLPLAYITCFPSSRGWFGPDEECKRTIKVQCSNADRVVELQAVSCQPLRAESNS